MASLDLLDRHTLAKGIAKVGGRAQALLAELGLEKENIVDPLVGTRLCRGQKFGCVHSQHTIRR